MPTATLDEIKHLADNLAPLDQVRLIEYLVPRLARVVAEAQSTAPAGTGRSADRWEEFLRLGKELAHRDRPEMNTLTAGVLSSRR
jgi:hypothetical protein